MYIKTKKINEVHYNMLTKYFYLLKWSYMVRTLLLKMEVRSSNFHTYNLGYPGYLGFR